MPATYKICTDWHPGLGKHPAARSASDQVATNERVDNVRIRPLGGGWPGGGLATLPALSSHSGMARAAVERLKLW